LLEQVLAAEPDNARAHALHAQYLANGQQKKEEAAVAYQRALELAPRDATTLADYGRYLYDNGEIERGMSLIDEAVSLDPLNITVLFDQCQTRAHRGQFDGAVATCRRIQEIAPDGPQGYYGEALAHAYTGDIAGTIKGYSEAIQRDPEDYEMLAAMAQFWGTLEDMEQARTWLERAEALGAGQPVPMISRVMFLNLQEQFERAGDLARQGIEQGVENRHGAVTQMRRANATQAMRSGDWERGLAPYRKVYPWAFEPELVAPDEIGDWIAELLHIARLMKSADPLSQRPAELMDVVTRHLDYQPPAWGRHSKAYREAGLDALRGEAQAAVGHLREARDLGLFLNWQAIIVNDPLFLTLASEPDYQELLTEFEAETESQREAAYVLLGISR
jgi:Tfp pilus assembly protein PilF